MNLQFSKNSHRVEKLQTNQSVENFQAYNGLLVNFDALNGFRLFGHQPIFDAIIGHHFEEAENKIQINVIYLRIFESKYLDNWT